MNDPQPSEEETVKAVYAFAAEQMQNGTSEEEIVSISTKSMIYGA